MTTASNAPRCFALLPCAGVGARSGAAQPKQYVNVAGQAVVAHTLAALSSVQRLSAALVVISPEDACFDAAVPGFEGERGWVARRGGAERADSVANGLAALRERGARDEDWVLVHDAVRCLLRPQWVERLIEACWDDPVGGLLAVPVADTLKQARDGRVVATLDRSDKWAAQTPQMFRIGLLSRALAQARGQGFVTDEASAVEALGLSPRLVPGDSENLKVTWPSDFMLAERVLSSRYDETRNEESIRDSTRQP